jgi:hypothetical protein
MTSPSKYHPLLFGLAFLTCAITLVLIGSGGTVTSTGVGMVDATWTFSPFKLFTLRGLEESIVSAGMFIEQSHRQTGFIVGMLALVLAGICFAVENGKRRWLGAGVLAAVVLQGALGAARILFNPDKGYFNTNLGRDYALIHGFFGQITFVFLAACTLAFSRSWVSHPIAPSVHAKSLSRFSTTLTVLFLLQLLVAVFVRHIGGKHLIYTHATLAGLILLLTLILLYKSGQVAVPLVQRPIWALTALVLLMVLLGISAWWFGAGQGPLDSNVAGLHRITLATAHQCLGALTLATSLLLTLRIRRHLTPQVTSLDAAA